MFGSVAHLLLLPMFTCTGKAGSQNTRSGTAPKCAMSNFAQHSGKGKGKLAFASKDRGKAKYEVNHGHERDL